MSDDHHRRIIFGWVQEGRSVEAQKRAGWSGVLSLPRVLSLAADHTLLIKPVEELQTLRGAHHHWRDQPLHEPMVLLPDVRGDTLEIIAEFDLGNAAEVGLGVRCTPDGSEATLIVYDQLNQRLVINREHASLDDATEKHTHSGSLNLALGEVLRLHVFVDRSMIEVFANDRVCLTSRVYPTLPDSLGVGVIAQGGTAHVRVLNVWELHSIWD
jgi:beta-fructofuranosidase